MDSGNRVFSILAGGTSHPKKLPPFSNVIKKRPMPFTDSTAYRQLRTHAESLLGQLSRNLVLDHDTGKLLHELSVHQIELELQNGELRFAQTELEKMRDRYVDLYESAPIAYFTLSPDGQIKNINRQGALLLKVIRGQQSKLSFEQFVMADDQANWRHYLMRLQNIGNLQTCELIMRRTDGTFFTGSLNASYASAKHEQELRISLSDVSEMRRTEQVRREFELRLAKLTKREKHVLVLALSGKINKDISAALHISQRAVENYRSRIHTKTGVLTLLELSHQAAAAGISLEKIVSS
jgi:DNA-binding CsgD family transcriptional regulator